MVLGETFHELDRTGRRIRTRRADFVDIPEQIHFLRQMIDVYRGTTWARETAARIIADARCPERNHACYALAIAEAAQARVQYVRERPERFQSPPNTWHSRLGDCDDFTTLEGTLMEAMGVPTEVVGMKTCKPGQRCLWRHVFIRALIDTPNGRRIRMPLDASLKGVPVRTLANPITRALERGMKVETLVLGA